MDMSHSALTVRDQKPGTTPEHTSRNGVRVQSGWFSYAQSYEGNLVDARSLDNVEHNQPASSLELNVFNLALVSVNALRRRKGLGTALVQQSLEVARERGFDTVRFRITNPNFLKIMGRLRREGLITAERYMYSPYTELLGAPMPIETEQLLQTTAGYDNSTDAAHLFDGMPVNRAGIVKDLQHGVVEGVIQL
jgi:GNAT superfamily N-acetyltransferase